MRALASPALRSARGAIVCARPSTSGRPAVARPTNGRRAVAAAAAPASWDAADVADLLAAAGDGTSAPPASVYLVGTGPGDPGLLTLSAARLMASADVVLYDRLVSPDILRLVNPAARMVYVGKAAGLHTRPQAEIEALLAAFAGGGKTVLRLKGGDPFVFGRGGEEAAALRAAGVSVSVVPGVTAAAGVCADLGIPATHRGVATAVTYMTGHAREGGEGELRECARAAADQKTTLVVYMGLATLPSLSADLINAGLSPDTPTVAVERGTTADCRTVHATLDDLPAAVAAAALQSPTLLVIGDVVALSPGWEAAFGVARGVASGAGAECEVEAAAAV